MRLNRPPISLGDTESLFRPAILRVVEEDEQPTQNRSGDAGSQSADPTIQERIRGVGAKSILLYVLGAVVVVVLAVTSLGGSDELPSFSPSAAPLVLPQPGDVPFADLETFEGLLTGQQGRPVVVNLWASWCPPCRAEMPLLERASRDFEGRATILGVVANDDPNSARAFLDELSITYPNVIDGTGQIQVALEMSVFPTTYVFGRDGNLTAVVKGGVSEQQLVALLEDALR